ncbi:hypothetical protein [Fredinandcohnia quinoae]|uniref:Flagellar protein FliT n=1 Tax=Fredinandcohnia quinoae TaxID=2918902 RepID=A0AAW5E503_9BACI|nr:hypothetical protein [Fredinandcohnia sp. SECRCQ15]MCH1625056.1 hypothetical protein [Fredinandcohnia sp. SECRCQ15]
MALKELYQYTEALLNHLDNEHKKELRDEYIEKVMDLLDKREQALTIVAPPVNDEEKKLGKQIIEMDTKIKSKLTILFTSIKQDIASINKAKTPQKKYRNPYESYNPDGRFFDKRK